VTAAAPPGSERFSISSTGVLAHRSAATSRRQLLWVDRTGNRLSAVGPPDDSAPATPALSPDGRRLALFRNVAGNPDIWIMELDRAVQSRFTSDPAIDDASRCVAGCQPPGLHVESHRTLESVRETHGRQR
jgi:hypothetical protein